MKRKSRKPSKSAPRAKAGQRITTFLWFDKNAEDAANFYVSLFRNSKILNVTRFGEAPGPKGSVMMATFQLEGQKFYALNGGPHYHFTPAISLYVECDTQDEVDALWDKLTSNGGTPSRCGWLVDRFGLSWQIIPRILPKLISDRDPAKAGRAMQAMLQMEKIDIAKLKQAHKGPSR